MRKVENHGRVLSSRHRHDNLTLTIKLPKDVSESFKSCLINVFVTVKYHFFLLFNNTLSLELLKWVSR
ncbi:Uncharacterised protein [Segatella copri]|nr:Uncharacterised protein [Segatella copri]